MYNNRTYYFEPRKNFIEPVTTIKIVSQSIYKQLDVDSVIIYHKQIEFINELGLYRLITPYCKRYWQYYPPLGQFIRTFLRSINQYHITNVITI